MIWDMRLLAVRRAAGLPLARDVPATDPRQMPVLRTGAQITSSYVEALLDMGIHAVWVNDKLSVGIEPRELVPPEVRQQTAARVARALADARRSRESGQPLSEPAARELEHVVEQIVAGIGHRPEASLALDDLAAAHAYTHQHAIDVCALGLVLGRELFRCKGWRDFRGETRHDDISGRLFKLGMGLLLHDVGKVAVPTAILDKPGRLDPAEMDIMRTHPEAGASLLVSDYISPLVRAVVRDHHERWDGSGYPRGVSGTAADQLARVCAVADVYDAVTSERAYKRAQPPAAGVDVILAGRASSFDPDVVDVFERVVSPYPLGSEVILPGGTAAVVSKVHEGELRRPTVRVADGDGFREMRFDGGAERAAA
jgi:HD-GYP domain-containing protein (c-di-GMP phosphodiesterase class II)